MNMRFKSSARASVMAAMSVLLLVLAGCGEDAQKPYTGPQSGLPYTPTPPPPNPTAVISTEAGDVTVELYEDDAPNTVANFISLADKGFYNGLTFHRVIKGFMIQGGDPKGDGTGGPGYKFPDEIDGNPNNFDHYVLAMANSGKDTNGSQFFIVTSPTGTPHLKRNPQTGVNGHTIFGKVTKGMDVVDKLEKSPVVGDRANPPVKITSIKITQKRNHTYEVQDKVDDPPPPPAAPVTPGTGTPPVAPIPAPHAPVPHITPAPAPIPTPAPGTGEKKTDEKKPETKPDGSKTEGKK
jgi:peptidyl-prolyl cis-trans isomerase B (cyclophilin B)